MTATDIWKIAGAILTSLGGAGVILLGLSNWIGKIWANRFLESERSRHAREIEKLKTELSKTVHVHRAQFDTEFTAYREIWKTLSDVKYAVLALRPFLDTHSPSESEDQRKQKRLGEYVIKYNAFFYTMDQARPFYSDSVWNALREVSSIMRSEASNYQQQDRFSDNYWNKARENEQLLMTNIENVCTAIRNRISSLSVIV